MERLPTPLKIVTVALAVPLFAFAMCAIAVFAVKLFGLMPVSVAALLLLLVGPSTYGFLVRAQERRKPFVRYDTKR
ncbi:MULTISPECIES: hypothetical protein [Brevundimonas]|uniref:Uncharacterized protein n=1 Tax=Brevundimonas nasdae TaxID=172043 RepID=A0ABX8TET1_9CAUL|nr:MULTISPECIES: hypothetical protein [Brevundimonas]MBU1384762.1 hypothetical protein [Alphaproteobacteria bacterium]MBU2271817.1 hypothetical protein [Alphaproteobacteria bacterium]MBU2419584.1 hypothetical protein [Alphaproteobacteria bacterium]MRL68938.1 hypothetical protein [Brevundimonas sp. SPF441]QYC09691.1 hypothetical protein KWG56_14035 [Brevundimonas nasdae]